MFNDTMTPAPATAVPTRARIAAFFKTIIKRHQTRKLDDLSKLSDHALQDVGVTRAELGFAGVRPTEFDVFRLMKYIRIPDARYETRHYR